MGNFTTSELLNTTSKNGSAQYLITALELQNQGLSTGNISRISVGIQNQGEYLNSLKIKMKSTTLSILSDSTYSPDNFTLVYDNANWQQPQSTAIFNFLQPFYWDGSSNIIIDFTFSSLTNASSYITISDSIGSNIGVLQNFNGHLDFQDDEIGGTYQLQFLLILKKCNCIFGVGDENLMPFNSYIFEGRDVNGFRVINCHLPWSK